MVVAERSIAVFLEEREIKPAAYSSQQLTSKDFHPEAIMRNFPLRNKPVFLHIRLRRCLIESTVEVNYSPQRLKIAAPDRHG